MERYKVELQTVMQYLNGTSSVLHVVADNEFQAEEKVSAACKILESDMSRLSVYRIYFYDITAVTPQNG